MPRSEVGDTKPNGSSTPLIDSQQLVISKLTSNADEITAKRESEKIDTSEKGLLQDNEINKAQDGSNVNERRPKSRWKTLETLLKVGKTFIGIKTDVNKTHNKMGLSLSSSNPKCVKNGIHSAVTDGCQGNSKESCEFVQSCCSPSMSDPLVSSEINSLSNSKNRTPKKDNSIAEGSNNDNMHSNAMLITAPTNKWVDVHSVIVHSHESGCVVIVDPVNCISKGMCMSISKHLKFILI